MKKSSVFFAFVFSAIGLMNTASSWAASSSNTANPTTTNKIAQFRTECLYLTYNFGGVEHRSTLRMKNASGIMITEFNVGPRFHRVQQNMRAAASPEGLFIVGANPIDLLTNQPDPSYNADNFLFTTAPNGDVAAVNCDDAKVCAPVRVSVCRR
jgi:hypothetical protein